MQPFSKSLSAKTLLWGLLFFIVVVFVFTERKQKRRVALGRNGKGEGGGGGGGGGLILPGNRQELPLAGWN